MIDLLSRLRSGADEKLKNRLISDFELNPKIKCRSYSKGNRQKFASPATWTLLAVGYALGPIGALLGLDDSVRKLSPFRADARGAGDDPQFGGALAVLAVAVLCAAVATIGMRRRVLTV